jgi:DNA invertase Pin-like site-specific DNA recombinase
MRQYALADAAVDLGWDRSQVVVLDGDLGQSGRTTRGRRDFQDLMAKVCQREAGLVFVLEASRLSRNSADFQRLLEFCQVTDTLIADADGVYDLRDFNDQLLLGFKGTMSAVELHILAQRMQEAKKAAARRGELRLSLPIGYVYDPDGQVVVDPDQEVQAAVADVFRAFEATGTCGGVVKQFRDRRFPTHGQAWTGEVTWMRLRQSQARAILRNPTYAGAYASGRYKSERTIDADGNISTRTVELPSDRWEVVIHDHHPGYIGWDTFNANQRQLAANRPQRGARPPREGPALLQGVVLCGHCGTGMGVYERARYEAARAERAFHLCEPENRLVARSLEQRWEAKLAVVAEAEAALQAQTAQRPPLPHTPDLEALAADLARLWNEPTTSPRDRKRILRTLINDVTLTSDPSGDEIRVGIRWRAGAHEEQLATRTRMLTHQHAIDSPAGGRTKACATPTSPPSFVHSAYRRRAATSSEHETCATSDTRSVSHARRPSNPANSPFAKSPPASASKPAPSTTGSAPARSPTASRPPAQYASPSPPTSKPRSALGQQWPASSPELNQPLLEVQFNDVIEGACAHLVRDRFDITGARWSLEGAEAVLKLRAVRANGDWAEYWRHHLAEERNRVHASRYVDGIIPEAA